MFLTFVQIWNNFSTKILKGPGFCHYETYELRLADKTTNLISIKTKQNEVQPKWYQSPFTRFGNNCIKPHTGTHSFAINQGQGLEFNVKYHDFHDFGISTPFKEKSSDHFKNLHELNFLTILMLI